MHLEGFLLCIIPISQSAREFWRFWKTKSFWKIAFFPSDLNNLFLVHQQDTILSKWLAFLNEFRWLQKQFRRISIIFGIPNKLCVRQKIYATKILLWSNHQTVFGQAFVSQKGVVANCDDFWKCSWWVYEKNALETWNKSSMFKHFFAANRSSSFIFF